ncbi:MAG: M23 family metallopeptidase [Chloroflexota bacterium]
MRAHISRQHIGPSLRLRIVAAVVLVMLLAFGYQGVYASPASESGSYNATAGQVKSSLRYVFPVQPAKNATFGRYHHDYPATDIFCPIGSLFVAPTSGVVDYVTIVDKWNPKTDDPAVRGGLSVAIIGDDSVRYYGSHLSAVTPRIVPGVRVIGGQTLGKTGRSGDARYVSPHLHFGISHPTTPDDWKTRRGEVSPYKYLRVWRAGTQLGPVLP